MGDDFLHDPDKSKGFNCLGTTLALGPGGTNTLVRLLAVIFDSGSNDFPDDAEFCSRFA
jgi:hypothetical protein